LVGWKQEQTLEVYAAGKIGPYHFIRAYPIFAESGTLGPKLREGDDQAPEGIYSITSLNPNSAYHLSLEVGYPNDFDRAMARREPRTHLGSAIMIHGNACSAGCLAMGDGAAEDLFVLAQDTGIAHVQVILSPVDFRRHALPHDLPPPPAWVGDLYAHIQRALQALPLPPAG
jgi:murein L,D-transpeptidase YafK